MHVLLWRNIALHKLLWWNLTFHVFLRRNDSFNIFHLLMIRSCSTLHWISSRATIDANCWWCQSSWSLHPPRRSFISFLLQLLNYSMKLFYFISFIFWIHKDLVLAIHDMHSGLQTDNLFGFNVKFRFGFIVKFCFESEFFILLGHLETQVSKFIFFLKCDEVQLLF